MNNEKNSYVRLMKTLGPFVIAGVVILTLYVALDWKTFKNLGGIMIAYFLPPLGKESLIPTGILALHLNPALVALSIAFIDIVSGLFLMWNFDLAKKIPILGKWIINFEKTGAQILKKRRWIKRFAFFGLILFVMFPFQGSGGVGATVLGRIMGFKPLKVWSAVIIGAVSGCLIIAYIAYYMGTALLGVYDIDFVKFLGIIIMFAVIVTLYKAYRKYQKKLFVGRE